MITAKMATTLKLSDEDMIMFACYMKLKSQKQLQ